MSNEYIVKIILKTLKEREKMEGNIYYIADENTYGFINGHDNEEYFFINPIY